MNWDALGAIGELVGATAVLVTLLYLAIQLRTANRFQVANHEDVHMDRIRGHQMEIARDADLTRIWNCGCRGDELDEYDAMRWEAIAINRILIQRDAWSRANILNIKEPDPDIYVQILGTLLENNIGLRRIWDQFFRASPLGQLHPSFTAKVNEIIE